MKRNTQCETISDFLNVELLRRKQRNGSYSLRAFARDLSISPSRLSEVMKGDKGLSEKMGDTLATGLHLKPRERQYWRDLILLQSRSTKVREFAQTRLIEARKSEAVRCMKEDQFRIIADWYHSAILELPQLQDFVADPDWIARRLGITRSLAEEAILRLEKIGILQRETDGSFSANTGAYEALSDTPSAAIRRYHRQILTMALDSLSYDPMETREFFSTILAVPKSRMMEFNEEMRKFITSFWRRIENDEKDELCALSLQLFPIRDRRQRYRPEDPS